jgi:hypothetical protein
MPIAQNEQELLNNAKHLNLDLEFIKKLYYYNKNLEDFIEMRMHEGANIKIAEIERDIV